MKIQPWDEMKRPAYQEIDAEENEREPQVYGLPKEEGQIAPGVHDMLFRPPKKGYIFSGSKEKGYAVTGPDGRIYVYPPGMSRAEIERELGGGPSTMEIRFPQKEGKFAPLGSDRLTKELTLPQEAEEISPFMRRHYQNRLRQLDYIDRQQSMQDDFTTALYGKQDTAQEREQINEKLGHANMSLDNKTAQAGSEGSSSGVNADERQTNGDREEESSQRQEADRQTVLDYINDIKERHPDVYDQWKSDFDKENDKEQGDETLPSLRNNESLSNQRAGTGNSSFWQTLKDKITGFMEGAKDTIIANKEDIKQKIEKDVENFTNKATEYSKDAAGKARKVFEDINKQAQEFQRKVRASENNGVEKVSTDSYCFYPPEGKAGQKPRSSKEISQGLSDKTINLKDITSQEWANYIQETQDKLEQAIKNDPPNGYCNLYEQCKDAKRGIYNPLGELANERGKRMERDKESYLKIPEIKKTKTVKVKDSDGSIKTKTVQYTGLDHQTAHKVAKYGGIVKTQHNNSAGSGHTNEVRGDLPLIHSEKWGQDVPFVDGYNATENRIKKDDPLSFQFSPDKERDMAYYIYVGPIALLEK